MEPNRIICEQERKGKLRLRVYAIGIPAVKREDVDGRQEVHHMHNGWRGGVEEGRITELSNEQPHRRMLNDNESRR